MKKIMLGLVAVMFAAATSAMAETQNVKVGGRIDTSYIKNAHMTLTDGQQVSDSSFMTQTKVYVAADLTDNVQAYVSVLNQREWDAKDNIGASAESGVSIDLAYVKLSEFLYSPLTVTVGRQEIVWGSGLVIGDGVPNPNLNSSLDNNWYGWESGFDAVKADFNFDPFKVSAFGAVINEDRTDNNGNDLRNEEDECLYGVNLAYTFPSETVVELYYVGSDNSANLGGVTTGSAVRTNIHTVGVRGEGALTPVDEHLTLDGELAYQWGDDYYYNPTFAKSNLVDRKAWAAIVGAEYAFQNNYQPKVSLYYDFRSGNELSDGPSANNGQWSAPYYSRGIGNIIDQLANRSDAVISNGVSGLGSTNVHAVTASGSFVPFQDLSMGLNIVYAKFDEEINAGAGKDLGLEFIGTVAYDYTEDVSFSLKGSFFNPNDGFTATQNEDAYELVGKVSVEF